MERKGRIGSLLREEGPLLGEEGVGPWFTPWGEEVGLALGKGKEGSLFEEGREGAFHGDSHLGEGKEGSFLG